MTTIDCPSRGASSDVSHVFHLQYRGLEALQHHARRSSARSIPSGLASVPISAGSVNVGVTGTNALWSCSGSAVESPASGSLETDEQCI